MFHITQREKLILPSIYIDLILSWKVDVSSCLLFQFDQSNFTVDYFRNLPLTYQRLGENKFEISLCAMNEKKKYQFRKKANIRELQHNIVNLIILQCSKIRNWICSRDFPLQTLFDQNSPYSHGEFCAYKDRVAMV